MRLFSCRYSRDLGCFNQTTYLRFCQVFKKKCHSFSEKKIYLLVLSRTAIIKKKLRKEGFSIFYCLVLAQKPSRSDGELVKGTLVSKVIEYMPKAQIYSNLALHCQFGHIYWRNPSWKIFCAVQVASIFQTISIGADLIYLRNEETF